jgi:hypothetical protein
MAQAELPDRHARMEPHAGVEMAQSACHEPRSGGGLLLGQDAVVAVLAIVLEMDRRVDGWTPGR